LHTKLEKLIGSKQNAIYCRDSDSIEEAAGIMEQNNILSMPVWSTVEGRWLGTVDVMGLTKYTTLGCYTDKLGFPGKYSSERVTSLLAHSESLTGHVFKIALLYDDDTLLRMMNVLSRMQIHRGFQMRRSEMMSSQHLSTKIYVISQSDIVRFLHRNISQQLFNAPISAVLSPIQVHTVNVMDHAMDGFVRIWTSGVQAVAVVDNHQKLIDTLSDADLRGMNADKLKNLLLPIGEFKNAMGIKKMPNVACSPLTPIRDVLRTVAETGVHRVWVLENDIPVNVVSLTNILNLFLGNKIPPTSQ